MALSHPTRAARAALACAVLALAALSGAHAALTEEQCVSAAAPLISAPQQIISRLTPCISGASAACCTAITGFVGSGSQLEGCTCFPDLLQQLLTLVSSNNLAKAAGVTADRVTGILQSCGVPYAGGSGAAACGGTASASSSATATATGAPLQVDLQVPTTTVQVAGTAPVAKLGGAPSATPAPATAVLGAAVPAPASAPAAPAPGPAGVPMHPLAALAERKGVPGAARREAAREKVAAAATDRLANLAAPLVVDLIQNPQVVAAIGSALAGGAAAPPPGKR